MNRSHALTLSLGSARLLIFATFVCGIFVSAQPAHADHAWSSYHWSRGTSALSLQLGDNLATAWDAYLTTASSDWSASSVLDTAIVAGNTSATKGRNTPKNCVPTSGRVEVCNAAYGSTGWLGIASIWVSGSHITQSTVKLNDTYFKKATYNTPAWKQFVMCQEIGHTFGLNHQDEDLYNGNLGSCMDYTNDPARNDGLGANLHPNQHDFDQLVAIYSSHLDASTAQSSSAAAAASVEADNASEWGRPDRVDRHGRVSRFERDLGNGNKIYTFVIWADDEDEGRTH